MNRKFLGSVAVALGLGFAGSVEAQYGGYPAAGYTHGSQASTVPVHPSLQQPPNQSQWPVNGSPSQEFAPKWSQGQPGFTSQRGDSSAQQFAPTWSQGGQPGFASQRIGPPQTQFVGQPKYLPQPYRTASSGDSANRDGSREIPQGPEAELLPESLAPPNEPSSQQPSAPAQPSHDRYHPTHPYSVPGHPSQPHTYHPSHQPGGQPPHHHPSHPVTDGLGTSVWSPRALGSVFRDAIAAPWGAAAPMHGGVTGGCGPAGSGPVPYGPVPLRNWFAGANLLFLTTEQNCDRRLLFDVGDRMPTLLRTGNVDPSSDVGFDVFLGRYLHGGRHALMVNYFLFNPSRETVSVNQPAAGVGGMGNPYDYRVPMPSWEKISYDVGMDGDTMNDMTVYDRYDDSVAYRVRRDVSFQGIEANFVSFGLGGAHRAGLGPMAGPCETGCGPKRGCAGPMIPGCNSNLQIRTMHGLRWFQFKDAFEFAASQTDYMYGKTSDDMYYDLETENNLYGYQLGARIDCALGCRVNVYAGSKFGIFANDARFRSRIGTNEMPAYVNDAYPSIAGDAVVTRQSDTVLATLGELDLGVGYRVNPCWTVRGGYRLYGMTGVATTVGSISNDVAHLPTARKVCADDSIFLHGGYVGAEYNW